MRLAIPCVESCLPDRLTQVTKPAPDDAVPDPHHRLLASAAEHLAADLVDQPAALGDRDEVVGHHQPTGRRVPARERLDADDLAGGRVDLGLVVNSEFTLLERFARSSRSSPTASPSSRAMSGWKTM